MPLDNSQHVKGNDLTHWDLNKLINARVYNRMRNERVNIQRAREKLETLPNFLELTVHQYQETVIIRCISGVNQQ